MNTLSNFPKIANITIQYLPTGNVWKSDDTEILNQKDLNDAENSCEIMTNVSCNGVYLVINKSKTYFPAGVLQQSVIHLNVRS